MAGASGWAGGTGGHPSTQSIASAPPRRTLLKHTRLNFGACIGAVPGQMHPTDQMALASAPHVTGPRTSVSLQLSDTRDYEPEIRARLGTAAPTTLGLPRLLPVQHSRPTLRASLKPASGLATWGLCHRLFHLTECTHQMVLESQLTHIFVNLLFTLTNQDNKVSVCGGADFLKPCIV